MAACGLSRMRELARSFPAAVRPSRPSAASPSMMKTAFVVAVVIRVRVHCRQFHWRQVTPASSRQITSPGLGCSMAGLAVRCGAEVLVSGGPDQPGRALVLVQVLAADWHQVRDRDRVVGVGEAVDAWQPGVQAAQQRLNARPGALGLGAERPVGGAPVGDLGNVFRCPAIERGPGPGLGSRQQLVADLVRRSWFQALGHHHQHAVVRAQLEYLGGHAGGREERACALARLSRGQHGDHRAAPPPTPGSNTVRAKRAACAELGFAYPWGRSPENDAESPVASTSACWPTVSSTLAVQD